MNSKESKWLCECSCGYCDFDSEAEAMESYSHKFCGSNPKIRERQSKSLEADYCKNECPYEDDCSIDVMVKCEHIKESNNE